MTALLDTVLDAEGYIQPGKVAEVFHTTLEDVAFTTGIPNSAIRRTERSHSQKNQLKLRETVDIINRITPWAGSNLQAFSWYRSEPIPAFGDLTAEEMVKLGYGNTVREYLQHLAMGGYA